MNPNHLSWTVTPSLGSVAVLAAPILLVALAGTGAAQAPVDASPTQMAANVAQTIRVPIHTAPSDHGIEYGVWAAGSNYKASFHDGFAFYPVLGPDYPENLPLRWRTESVTVGGVPLFAPGTKPVTAHTDWRFEYRYPGFVEAYDVRTDGVEQTFTLLRRPEKPGDFVVVGRVASRLAAVGIDTEQHGAVTFDGPKGEPVVRYGEAFALDARGVKTPMQTSRDGDRITLRVPARWLDRATFPVTIDPLLESVALTGASIRSYHQVDMATPTQHTSHVYLAYSQSVSASDSDAYLVRAGTTIGGTTVLFSDVTTSWRTPAVAVAEASIDYDGRGSIIPVPVIAMQRDYWSTTGSQVTSAIAWHVNRGQFSTVSTALHAVYLARRRPDVGGSHGVGQTKACIVWEQDATWGGTNTPNTEIVAATLDITLQSDRVGSPVVVASTPVGNTRDREFPAISESAPWVVAYQERASAGSTYDVHTAMFTDSLQNRGRTSFSTSSSAPQPKVGGGVHEAGQHRFLVAYRDGANCATRRIDWSYATNTATLRAAKQLPFSGFPGGVAFDTDTRSHFCVTVSGRSEEESSATWSENHFYRLGHSGGIVESGLLGNGGNAATTPVAHLMKHPFFGGPSHFFLVWQRHTYYRYISLHSLLGQRLAHDPEVGNFHYGTGCAGQISATTPYAGIDEYTVSLTNAGHVGQTAWLYVCTQPGAAFVRQSCYVNIDTSYLVQFYWRTIDSSGNASVTFPLPDDPVFLGDYFMQWVWTDGNGTLFMTDGLRARVGA